MALKEKINTDLKMAMRAGDAFRRDTLRLLDSAIKNSEIAKKKREIGLDDNEVLEVILRAVKQRQDSVVQFEKGGRFELAEKEKKEMDILSAYLPEQLSKDDVRFEIKKIIEKNGVVSTVDFGKAMGLVMAELKGRADGNLVKDVLKEEIEKSKE